jgi:hypothetical protein
VHRGISRYCGFVGSRRGESTGSRADPQAALKNLLAALANAVLVVDNTTA